MANGKIKEKITLEEEILAPYNHLLQVRGKQLREKIVRSFNYWLKVPNGRLQDAVDIMKMLHNAGLLEKIVRSFNYWLKVPNGRLQDAVDIMKMLHNAGLLLDDVQDDSLTRRGLPSAHCVYGVALTLNATIQIMMKAAQKASQLVPSREGAQLLIDHIYDAVTGQGYEIYWRDTSVCPTEDEYFKMLTLKTGKMILLGVKLMQLFSTNKKNYDKLVERIGLYLQLRDDYCNLGHEEVLEEMPGEEDILATKDGYICEDITEGKFTLPVIYAMRTPEGPQVLNIIQKRTRNLELKKYCLGLLEKSGGMQYTRDMLIKMDLDLRAELASLGGNPLLEELLDDLLSWKSDTKYHKLL